MDTPDLSTYQSAYRGLEVQLDVVQVSGGDPKELLITFPLAESKHALATVTCNYSELTAFCPWTKMPDQGSLLISYQPNGKLLELKSLKYYLLAFRDIHITQEHLCQKVFNDLKEILEPAVLNVVLDYMPRGGIHTVVSLNG